MGEIIGKSLNLDKRSHMCASVCHHNFGDLYQPGDIRETYCLRPFSKEQARNSKNSEELEADRPDSAKHEECHQKLYGIELIEDFWPFITIYQISH